MTLNSSLRADLEADLRDGLGKLSLRLSDLQVAKLLAYVEELARWNRAYNLTAVRDPKEMVYLHLLDSLAILPYLRGRQFADVGTGAGIPGIPLAIACPERRFHLIDSNGKKTRFVFQVRNLLGLDNVIETQARVEAFRPDTGYDGVISRAFASVPDMITGCAHLVRQGGRFYAMKGKLPQDELRQLPKNYKVVASRVLGVPGVDAERHLIEIENGL